MSQDVTNAQLLAELQALREENAKLKATKPTNGMKITEKGGLSVYGLGRFPVTLYKSQWRHLMQLTDQIKAFIEADEAGACLLKEKPSKAVEAQGEGEVKIA